MGTPPSKTSYVNINDIETSGASETTSRGDGLSFSGVPASHHMAKADSGRMERYKSMIKQVGSQYGIDPALIAGIISRESRAGRLLDNGWGDYKKAWGLMQVDVTPNGGNHDPEGDWDSEEHLCQATEILMDFIEIISNKFPDWSKAQQLKGGIAAYNMGDKNVTNSGDVDRYTTGHDYSNDVVARAQWYKNNCGY